ncbi:hypothetical protein LTS07_002938 [Exophiala sideris]|uniref:P-loop containing nucleoside triphosphate hydrolase protein n=1 Tax=Exophiala sideris TaxID=1016849 RepID=A0ABR0JKW4_9EURO|nr:hypothetical protein LTS07_002938 [Exophiala sideris]KAK5039149.1 hypothetical protein LTR13_003405 [Exophiala sideris]KAK5066424.1 hypothetical protein LTR69_002944 [Exophiala sideris]KAK5187101.1 hypothetical protein LTR44_001109 [Eurotiomycetes sp. CCFEE 6388]
MTTPVLEGKPLSVPEVDILFLGSPGVGKSTFLSRLEHVRNGKLDLTTVPQKRVSPSTGPQTFEVTLFDRPYQFRVHPSTSTLFIDPFPDKPAFAIIAYSVSVRESLHNAQYYWRKQLSLHYDELEHEMPVMLLGLKRDERNEDRLEDGSFECVMPQEGLRVAQEMRCDRYAECSALTGELIWEVLEDITRTAAKTTTENGALSQYSCCMM